MYSFLASGFALTLILYPLSPAGAGLVLTFILTTSLFFRSSYFAHISVSPPCFFLLLIIFLNLIQWTLDPDRFSQDWTIRLKSMQGYSYLALMMLTVPLVREGHYKTTDPDRFAIFFLLTGIPAIYSIAYIFSLLASKGGRASFLIEHNFEIAFLNIIISLRALALRFNAFPSCLMWPKGTNMWFQGVFNSVATRSLSGSLGLALIMVAHKNLTRSVFTHNLNLQTLFIALKSKIFARLIFFGFLLLTSVGLAILTLRGGGVGVDRLSYFNSLSYLDLPDLIFGIGVSSVLPPDMSNTLLLQENLK